MERYFYLSIPPSGSREICLSLHTVWRDKNISQNLSKRSPIHLEGVSSSRSCLLKISTTPSSFFRPYSPLEWSGCVIQVVPAMSFRDGLPLAVSHYPPCLYPSFRIILLAQIHGLDGVAYSVVRFVFFCSLEKIVE